MKQTYQLLTPVIGVILFLFTSLFYSCNSEEILTDPGTALSFSVDTLSFDTIFSTVSSTTAWLKVRNTGDKAIRIATIRLQSGGTSGFRFNLDGIESTSISNVDILAHDSLFLFIEITPNLQGSPNPEKVTDAVLFDTDGPQRQIVLEAWSWDAVFWRGKTLSADTTLTATHPIVIRDSLVVSENAILTLLPGVRFYFHDGAFLKVNGTISALGTKESPILMRGDRLDEVLTDLPYDTWPGQWSYVQLTSTSFNNRLEYVDIHGAYYGIIADSSSISESKLKMYNSKIYNMMYTCIWSNASNMEFGNCLLYNSGSYTVALIGGISSFTHCTLANYIRLVDQREGPTLVLVNYRNDSKDTSIILPYPMSAEFNNCIVMGSQSDEIGLGRRNGIAWNALFKNCLLRLSERLSSTIATTTNSKYNTDAKFLQLGDDTNNYQCDFRLDSASVARNSGSTDYLITYPTDMNGVSRLLDGKPDIGAYEWFSGQNKLQ